MSVIHFCAVIGGDGVWNAGPSGDVIKLMPWELSQWGSSSTADPGVDTVTEMDCGCD